MVGCIIDQLINTKIQNSNIQIQLIIAQHPVISISALSRTKTSTTLLWVFAIQNSLL